MNNYGFSYNNRFSPNNKDKMYLYIFKGQVILNALIIFIFSAMTKNLYLFIPIFLNLLALKVKSRPQKISERLNFVFQLFLQVFIIAESYFYLITFSTKYYDWNLPSSLILFLVSVLVMYIPYVVVFLTPFENKFVQLLLSVFSFEFIAMGSLSIVTYSTILDFNPLIARLSDTRFMGALVFLVMALVMMRKWGYPYPHMVPSRHINYIILFFLLLLCFWFTMWNAFSGGKDFLSSLYTFDFSHAKFRIEYLLSGLEAGIAEEVLFRYMFLTILLAAFKNFRWKIFFASFISSLCFGLLHLSNLSAGQDLPNTINQVVFATGMGLLMCGLYLYSDMFFIPVIFHTLLDALAFTTSGEVMTGKVTNLQNIFTVVETLIFIAIALGLLIAVYRRNHSDSNYFTIS